MSTLKSKVTITQLEYDRLLEASLQLEHLEAMGVDNWEGYSYYKDDEEEEDYD